MHLSSSRKKSFKQLIFSLLSIPACRFASTPEATICVLSLRMWSKGESEGLQTLGIVVVVCSSLKLLHYLGLIDLSDGKRISKFYQLLYIQVSVGLFFLKNHYGSKQKEIKSLIFLLYLFLFHISLILQYPMLLCAFQSIFKLPEIQLKDFIYIYLMLYL